MSRNHARLDWRLWAQGRRQAFERGQHVAPGVERDLVAQALDWMREGDTLVVWRLDRLGRSLPQLVATVRRLEEKGFGLRSLTEGIDTASTSGTLVFHVFGALAQFERDLIRERTLAGLAAARARGRRGGRPVKLTPELRRRAEAMLRDTKGCPASWSVSTAPSGRC